jgi:hypothetical protein
MCLEREATEAVCEGTHNEPGWRLVNSRSISKEFGNTLHSFWFCQPQGNAQLSIREDKAAEGGEDKSKNKTAQPSSKKADMKLKEPVRTLSKPQLHSINF